MSDHEKQEMAVPRLRQKDDRVILNWKELNFLVNGVSTIDRESLSIRNMGEARRFAREYGFNLSNPADRTHIQEVHREALAFIEEFFVTPEQAAEIPAEIREPADVLDLLVYSSNYLNEGNIRQMWACAVLKVMHGIFHIDHDFKLRYFDLIRDQIFETLDRVIISEGSTYLLKGTDNVRIPLYYYEKKRNKGRKSILLKLLQKPRYVAADIYDHLGIRLIFETKAECLFALQHLRKQHLVTATNIKPFRSRNSLIDLKEARRIFKKYRTLLESSAEYPEKILRRMDSELETTLRNNIDNPHTSSEYQAIQVTARKMVHVPSPNQNKFQEILTLIGDKVELPAHLRNLVNEREMTIYFDFEIQLLDKNSYLRTQSGPASHGAYKARQRDVARKRVLGEHLIKVLDSNIAGTDS